MAAALLIVCKSSSKVSAARADAQHNISRCPGERMRALRLFFLTDLQYKSGSETFRCRQLTFFFVSIFCMKVQRQRSCCCCCAGFICKRGCTLTIRERVVSFARHALGKFLFAELGCQPCIYICSPSKTRAHRRMLIRSC